MNRGPKLKSNASKKLAGTYKECVDGDTIEIVHLNPDVPVQPNWLSTGAKKVWHDDLARVVACGAREPDSNFFAMYCELMSQFVAGVQAGTPPNAAFAAELRKQMEMLSIAGAKARLARVSDNTPSSNPFAKFK